MAYKGTPQGTLSTTRYKIGNATLINNNTVYNALRRLHINNMIELSSTGKKTLISICNWHKYQAGDQPVNQQFINSSSTVHQHSYKNKIENKNIDTTYLVEMQGIYDLYCSLFEKDPNRYRLTPQRKIKLRQRLKQNGREQLEQAIRNTASSPFHRGENDRGWQADLDYIIRSQEQVERLATANEQKVSEDWRTKHYDI